MKHIVFVIGYYYPEAGSTSLCAIKVMNDLMKRYEVEISCVCGTNSEDLIECLDGRSIYRIHHVSFTDCINKTTTNWQRRELIIKKTFRDLFNLRYYPDMDRGFSQKIFTILNRIESAKHIDCVVAVYMPKQSLSGVLMFKEKYPEINAIAYFLDTLRSNKPRLLPMKVHTKMLDRYENIIFNKFDKIILMRYGLEYYSKKICDKYKSKISFLNLPSLSMLQLEKKKVQSFKCSYIGTTYSDIRNPSFALKVFDEINKLKKEVVFQIYGPSNMKNELLDWQIKHSQSFSYHDFINHQEIISVYEDTDYVVSIGNTLRGVVPGKTFEIVGTLKPIIHFTDGANDSSLEFIKKYPNVCIINYQMSIKEAVKCLMQFFARPYRMCDSNYIESIFYEAKPDAVSDIIYGLLG